MIGTSNRTERVEKRPNKKRASRLRLSLQVLITLLLLGFLIIPPRAPSEAAECAQRKNISLYFAIDISSSMEGERLVAARNFAVKLINDLNATGSLVEGGSLQFCNQTVAFNTWMNPTTLRNNLSQLSITCAGSVFDGTALFDAIVNGATEIRTRPASNLRLFVVITDGDDSGASTFTANDAANKLSGGDITARLVFIGSGSSPTLNGIANAAGPKVKAVAGTPANLNSLVSEIVNATCINFRPTAAMNLPDPEFHLGTEGFSMNFDASPSSDVETPDSGLSFHWVFTRPDGSKINRHGMTISQDFNDDQLPNEVWSVNLEVTDPLNAKSTTSRTFRVIGSPPNINVTGPTSIDVLQNITLQATPTTDIDGGNLSIVWDIVESPPGSSHGPQSNFHTGATLPPITTTGSDIGRWKFKATATDDEGATDTAEIVVDVKNLPPEIDLVGEHDIAAGEPLRVETTIIDDIDDEDGGLLSFEWDIIQAPQSAPIAVQGAFHFGTGLDGSSLEIPTTASYAGTWIVKLRATDNDNSPNSETSQYFTVVVDGPPTAEITGPTEIGSLSFPLELSGESSVDPDSPCLTQADRCHNTLEPPVREISYDIASYSWSLIDVPFELWDKYPLGPVDEVLGENAHSSKMTLDFGDIEPGEWTFRLEVTDAEGNEDSTTFKVTVVDENGRPTAVVNEPARYLVDVSGLLSQNIVLNGGQSFDLDNLLAPDPFGPGVGITNYQWNVVEAPTGCTAPVIPAGPNQNLFAAGSIVQPACQGFWRIQLIVTDDDNPAKTDKAETTVIIGNCPQAICIDYPTHFNPQFVEFVEGTDILVYYHLDSTLYDNPGFQSGMFISLEIFHESDPDTPVFTSMDANVLATNKGGNLIFNWNGYSNRNERPLPGRYNVRISAVDANLINVPGTSITEEEAIWIAIAEPKISPTSDRYQDFNELDTGTGQLEIDYEIRGIAIPDQLRWRVRNASSSVLFETTAPAASTGTISWNGQIVSSTIPPGSYNFELEAFRGGASLGVSEVHPFVIYRLRIAPSVGAPSSTPPGTFVFVNSDDDNRNNVSDFTEVAPGENDLVQCNITVEPAIAGVVTLSSTNPTPPFKLWSTAAKAVETLLPATFNTPADTVPAQLFIEGKTAAQSDIQLQLQTTDGVTLGPVKMALTTVDVQVMLDSNNDHSISGADAATFNNSIARWDNAYDAAFTVSNNADPANFIEQDPSRFYLRVRNPFANADPSTVEQITLRMGTLTGAAILDDDLTDIVLVETGINTGVFVSRSQLLTSHDIQADNDLNADDEFLAHDGSVGTVGDDIVGDRTHRAEIDGALRILYQPGGPPSLMTWDVPVCSRNPEERRRLEVRVTVFNEPFNDVGFDHDGNAATPVIGAGNAIFDFTDTNGNGQHDAGERCEPFLDLSSGAVVFGVAGSRGGVVTQQDVDDQIKRANIAWAQACIKVVSVGTTFRNAPTNAMGNDILADGTFGNADEALIVSTFGPAATVDVLELFFVAPFVSGANAYTRTPSDLIAGLDEKTFSFLQPGLTIDLRTFAHEIGHALDNGWDNANIKPIFYPALNTFQDNNVNSYRRMINATITNCRTVRATGNMMGTGNRLLKMP